MCISLAHGQPWEVGNKQELLSFLDVFNLKMLVFKTAPLSESGIY
jgi:hypothetical protein